VRSIDRLDSFERFPLHITLWEGLGAGQRLGDFTQSATPAGDPFSLVARFGFCVLKQKYRTLHPGGNKQANVQYYVQKKQAIVNFFGRLCVSFNCKLIIARVFYLAKSLTQ